jgi:very-long-chain enoyl-CoA reductase
MLRDVLGEKAKDGELQVKDLGPQVSWRTVFLVEYVRVVHITSPLVQT